MSANRVFLGAAPADPGRSLTLVRDISEDAHDDMKLVAPAGSRMAGVGTTIGVWRTGGLERSANNRVA